ncbi:hypothetical protein B296_00056630 [Ensete ventricosum]|uniref:Uncharacterized protein n=1 Tax=Ensete ventricosum TaxID=4639 RepID=A0A426WXP4_ENSVE|nr:hypothetical protein B296_00056630 [Ensete ventricosum]
MGCCPCGRSPLAGGLAAIGRPLQVARPWPVAPAGGLAVASHLCMQTTYMWSPPAGNAYFRCNKHVEQFYVIQSHNTEIVYPCIPDLDGEDKGGQTSSSLAVSTQWISAAKLLRYDLATLAQREGGE